MVRARSGDVISAVTVDEDWIRITRGPAPLDPATFTLRGAYRDRFRVLGHTVPPAGQPAAH